MIDLVFWSFVVALSPIVLGLASKLLAVAAAPLGPPETGPFARHRRGFAHHAPHFMPTRISRREGFGHDR